MALLPRDGRWARIAGPNGEAGRPQPGRACERGCRVIPGPACTCGWYVCQTVADLRPLVAAYQHHHTDRDPDLIPGVAIAGVRLTHPIHTAPPLNSPAGRKQVTWLEDTLGIQHFPVEGDGTYRGRRVTIVGPIVTTLTDPAAVAQLGETYAVDVLSSPRRMLELADLMDKAGRVHGQTPRDLGPHLPALFAPSTAPHRRRPPMAPAKKTTPARTPRRPATRDHLTAVADDGSWAGMLGDVEIRVLPFSDWTKDAMNALHRANFDRWAEGAVHPEDVQKFVHADVTMGQVIAFMSDSKDVLNARR